MEHCLENCFTHLMDESNLEIVHSGESHLGKFYFEFSPVIPLIVGNGVFILGLQDHDVDLFELKFLEEDGKIRESLKKIDIKIKTPQDVNFYFGEQVRVSQLNETKFLMAVFKTYEYEPSIEVVSQYYQEFFLNGLKWFLLDLKNMEFERVYPKVYEIGNQISINQNHDADNFSLVKRKKSRGRNNVHSSPKFYQDGDLNGGYSDSNLFESFKKYESYNFQFTNPHNMEMIHNYNALSLSSLNSCRPFNNSPDLFQVYFTVSYCLEGTNSDEKVKEEMWNSDLINMEKYLDLPLFSKIYLERFIERVSFQIFAFISVNQQELRTFSNLFNFEYEVTLFKL